MPSMLKDWINKLTLFVVVAIAFVDGMLVADQWKGEGTPSEASEAIILEDIFEQKNSSIEALPSTVNTVPFISQAPYGVWDKPWSDYAEEASMLMASKWAKNETLNQATVPDELLAIGTWEGEQFGTSANTDALQTLRVLKEFLGLDAELSYSVDQESLKRALNEGKILLVPVNGKILANSHYGDPAPEFHMILIYGHEGENFLTHDPGTIRGDSTVYEIQKVLESIQDLNGEDRVIVINSSF